MKNDKKAFFCAIMFFPVVSVVIFLLTLTSKPAFIADAQVRLESYLRYSFGPLNCSNVKIHQDQWEINCNSDDGRYYFSYFVQSEPDFPRGYELTAMNDNAIKSRDVDLLRYLSIK